MFCASHLPSSLLMLIVCPLFDSFLVFFMHRYFYYWLAAVVLEKTLIINP